ncbi:PTS sugar transporter subunit IIA [Desulfovibrio inopinatus]|uniref:PTS sugar transporter subunit IIA n=1 Tax=Desulfovibrio inopinatus TaxID=102109 RepID=UPI0003F7FEEB|nr:PTS sugar transporter subunit IIA [Desulfovibrio inopinatus]
MQLVDFLDKDLLLQDIKAQTKSEVLAELVGPLKTRWPDLDLERARRVLLERESLGTTGIGDGVAIPHGKLDSIDQVVIVVGRSLAGLDFDALDQKPCFIFFLVLAPEPVAGLHLRILAHISRLLSSESFRSSFVNAKDKDALWDVLTGGV